MITNAIAPYCYDVSVIAGLPTNLSHRFRYRERWIKLDRDIKTTTGDEALIILRVQETGELIPVRFVRIEEILRVGDISFIEFRMRELCTMKAIDQASEHINSALRIKGYVNKPGASLDSLVLELEQSGASVLEKLRVDDEDENWAEMAKKLGTLSCFKDFSFLKVLDIRDVQGKVARITVDETGRYSFSLDPGRVYFLDVMQHVPWQIEETERIEKPYDVELNAETEELEVLRKIQRVVGKYDLLRFIFKTSVAYETRHTYLELNNKQGTISSEFSPPVVFLPLRVRLSGWRRRVLWLRRVAAVVASLGIIASGFLSHHMGIPVDWIWLVCLLALVLATNKVDDFVSATVKDVVGARIK
jgi:hypothetical protein